ncbi:MAG: dihydrolipoamide acetyltransferase family protein [Caldilineaceae bacterium]
MATEIVMPRLGWTMEEGTFGVWLKNDGDVVKSGDMLFTIEGDKATQEVEALEDGIFRLPANAAQSGDVLPVGALLAYIVQPGEKISRQEEGETGRQEDKRTGGQDDKTTVSQSPDLAISQSPNLQSPISTPTISPRARRVAKELGIDWAQITGSGRTGRIVERDVRAAAAAQPATTTSAEAKPVESKLRVTPVAQRMAQEAGIDTTELAKQKGVDKIDRAEVESAIAQQSAIRAQGGPPPQSAISNTQPISRIRRIIAERMVESLRTTAPVTLTTEADATNLVALRQQLKSSLEPRGKVMPSYNDLLIRLSAVALQDHPMLNATWGQGEIILHDEIAIGLAVDTKDGLLVPVVRNAQSKSVQQIASETRTLVEQCQSGQISADALNHGTFTISNLGAQNIDAFTPVINLPQCAILGVGRIVKKPAVVNDQVVVRQMVALSLTFDHRLVDGAPAARFLNQIREFVEEPALWLTA